MSREYWASHKTGKCPNCGESKCHCSPDQIGMMTVKDGWGMFSVGDKLGVLVCKCGGREFNLGRGAYTTAVRCVECKTEVIVHEG